MYKRQWSSENILVSIVVDAYYPNADFAALYGCECPNEPACVKSWTGFIIPPVNCLSCERAPFQDCILYNGGQDYCFGSLLQGTLPYHWLGSKFCFLFQLDLIKTTMKVSFHEDNAAALIMANSLPLNTCYTINSFSWTPAHPVTLLQGQSKVDGPILDFYQD